MKHLTRRMQYLKLPLMDIQRTPFDADAAARALRMTPAQKAFALRRLAGDTQEAAYRACLAAGRPERGTEPESQDEQDDQRERGHPVQRRLLWPPTHPLDQAFASAHGTRSDRLVVPETAQIVRLGNFAETARVYHISVSRVHQIVTRHERATGEVLVPSCRDKPPPRRASARATTNVSTGAE